ncbi:MAG: hypothetical protein WC997_07145 [Porticoccaceae bacterium]
MNRITGLLIAIALLSGCATGVAIDGGSGGVRGGISTTLPL